MLKNDLHALRYVGTHGPCVRARRMKHKCTIIRADARAVRPYIVQAERNISSIDNQRLTPCVSISPILPCNIAEIARQYGSYYTVKWVRLECRKYGVDFQYACAWSSNGTDGACRMKAGACECLGTCVCALLFERTHKPYVPVYFHSKCALKIGTYGPVVRSNSV